MRKEACIYFIVTQAEYLPHRLSLLEKEKEVTRARDAVSKERRKLPLVEVTTPYTFTALDEATGKPKPVTLLDLFAGRPQLIIYHFMFDPEWDAGCPSCSLLGDTVPPLQHLNSHSTTFVAVSRAPIEKITAYKKRMGWSFPWVSSSGTSFNYDFHVTGDDSIAPVQYNFKNKAELESRGQSYFARGEQPGHSVFIVGGRLGVGEEGKVYHSYSTYSRGGEQIINTLSWLDMTPLGRQDGVNGVGGLGYKRHDEYTEEDLKGLDVKIQA
ncbi:uncharacterized protein Z518_08112 [Rhinocladiella mackenziei CBS 650.93]|uniref:Rhinocladiella mackenziei CBS 650.93 unplaced genomic scaffold supercont1.6, whole genome shotgun sequence n=1 Tax=Rhinocladiella mackenziei CBS 650.93 TaxID=1442369 RepID=A0A0D2GV60_9EURO|nr:uncharacterized protein Z518_08112 [Rhinocladiella mackenziei CBS 650.93]KIX02173.1 hypothetical protein Z518_08112 [Rhinocladiella mackenziei CBS 650.93]